MRPDVFNRVKFRCLGSEEIEMQTGLAGKQFLHLFRAMRLKTVSQDNNMSRHFLQKTTKESHNCTRINVSIRMESKVQAEPILARSNAQGADN